MQGMQADLQHVAQAEVPSTLDKKEDEFNFAENDARSMSELSEDEPTEEELHTLRRVSGKIPWQAYTVAVVEFCERFSWYGTTAVFVNFIQQPRPPTSRTGAIVPISVCDSMGIGHSSCLQAGAIGADQQASTGLTTFNQFWAYLIPLFGGWVADEFWGRYKTIQWSILAAVIGHIFLIVSSIPTVLDTPNAALGIFAVGLVVLGFGTGGFKSNISPLMAEQLQDARMHVITTKSGERVVVDPAVTVSRVYLYFYLLINAGSLVGGISMVYAERYIGFWLSYALPTFLFFFCPLILKLCKHRYNHMPPAGSVLGRSIKLLALASKGCWSLNPAETWRRHRRDGFWDAVKPSVLGSSAPDWMAEIDDAWVDQVKRGFAACRVFTWYPLYWLAYNQMVGNLTSQSATMQLNGVPNDLINNLNPLTLVIFIPIMDHVIYKGLRKANIRFTPIKRITFGFFLASMAMVSAAVVQYYIYRMAHYTDTGEPCPIDQVNDGDCVADINVWVQAVPYCLIAFSEIFASITGLEYAFTKAPENMRSLIMGVNLLQNAFAAAIGNALVPLAEDPLLTWNYGVVAVLAFVGGVGFWFTWRDLDAQEDKLNRLKKTQYKGRHIGAIPNDVPNHQIEKSMP